MRVAQHSDLIATRRRLMKAAREISSEYADRLMPRTTLQKLTRTLNRVEDLDARLKAQAASSSRTRCK